MERKLTRRESAPERHSSTAGITPYFPDENEARALGNVLDRYRFTQGWQPLPTDDHNRMVAAWFEVLSFARVPHTAYDACYRAAMQHRAELKRQGKDLPPLSADDLVAEWASIREMHAEIDKSRALPEHARGACRRCYGTGMERMPNGSVRPGCKHEPMGDEEEEEIDRNVERDAAFIRSQAELMREALERIGSPKPAPVEAGAPTDKRLKCDSCGRLVMTLYGFRPGDNCGELLNRGTDEGELRFCGGAFTSF